MKNCLIISICAVVAFSISSCKIYPPVLKSLDKIKVERNGTTGFIVGTEAVINNPNTGRLRIKNLDFDISINNKPIASLGKKTDILIKRNTDFTVPLSIEVNSLESVFGDMNSILGMLKNKEAELSLKGNIKLRAFGILNYRFPVTYKQKVNLPSLLK